MSGFFKIRFNGLEAQRQRFPYERHNLRGVSEKFFDISKYSITRSTPLLEPAITVWAGSFCLRQQHSVQIPPHVAEGFLLLLSITPTLSDLLLHQSFDLDPQLPMDAISRPLALTAIMASLNDNTPAATAAEYSPSECPATMSGVIPKESSSSNSATSMVNVAGW